MARAPRLKVFRMAVGFHDAYVAAPSQKAAAAAWGADLSVFSRGEAELVTDPALTEAPLAEPGKVVKRLRGTADEQIAALGPVEAQGPRRAKARAGKGEAERPPSAPESSRKSKPEPKPKPEPRPSRAALDEAEAALEEVRARHSEAKADIARREAEIARERKALEAAQAKERDRLEARREKEAAAYEAAMRTWREA
jgi:hypothetical protein